MFKPLLFTALLLPAAAFAECEPVVVGDLSVSAPWSRATIGASRPAVFYVTVTNTGSEDDALTGIASPIAGMPMLHETVVKDDVVSMPHAISIPVPAGETVRLAPGSYHGMLMDLTGALKEGDSFPVTLTFQNGDDVTIDVPVLPLRAGEAECAAAP